MDQLIEDVTSEFNQRFAHANPLVIQSPGRVNLIGEHTDYNEGFVLPAAINRVAIMALASNGSSQVNTYSADLRKNHSFDLKKPLVKSDEGWPNYIMGAVDQLIKAGYDVQGFDLVFGANIPIGAGLSSSAAVEDGVLYGVSELFGLNVPRLDIVKMGQKTENEFVGVNCGVMDQFINVFGEENRVLKLDCRSLDYELVPFERDDLSIILCDTQVRRELASSEYNKRRKQCEKGVAFLQDKMPDKTINSLRDVSLQMLEDYKNEMDPVVHKRCKYVVEENHRVLDGSDDLSRDDFNSFGKRMYASHDGLSNDYEVSCEELDVLVEEAQNIDGVYGARMMGAGFGGCTINLVEDHAVDSFTDTIIERYSDRTGKQIEVYKTSIGPGTKTLDMKAV